MRRRRLFGDRLDEGIDLLPVVAPPPAVEVPRNRGFILDSNNLPRFHDSCSENSSSSINPMKLKP